MNYSRQQLARRPRRNAAAAGALLSALLVFLVAILMVVDQLHKLDDIQSTLAFKVQGVPI